MNPFSILRKRRVQKATEALWVAMDTETQDPRKDLLQQVAAAIQRGADPNAATPEDRIGFLEMMAVAGWRPLHRAALLGNEDVVSLLLKSGAQAWATPDKQYIPDIPANSENQFPFWEDNSRLPVFLAARQGHDTVVKKLIEHMGPSAQETDFLHLITKEMLPHLSQKKAAHWHAYCEASFLSKHINSTSVPRVATEESRRRPRM